MSIYTVVFWFYALIVAWMVTVLGCRWVKQVEERMSIEKNPHARALQGEDEQPVLDALTFPQARTKLLDPNWKYTKSEATDVKKTWDKFRPLDPK